jgi:hypothetical protein
MKHLELCDQRHLEAAEGWVELGNYLEATEELEQITPKNGCTWRIPKRSGSSGSCFGG